MMDSEYLRRLILMYSEQLENRRIKALTEGDEGLMNHYSGGLVAIAHIMEYIYELEQIERKNSAEHLEFERIKGMCERSLS